jgi:hypothetical protein
MISNSGQSESVSPKGRGLCSIRKQIITSPLTVVGKRETMDIPGLAALPNGVERLKEKTP